MSLHRVKWIGYNLFFHFHPTPLPYRCWCAWSASTVSYSTPNMKRPPRRSPRDYRTHGTACGPPRDGWPTYSRTKAVVYQRGRRRALRMGPRSHPSRTRQSMGALVVVIRTIQGSVWDHRHKVTNPTWRAVDVMMETIAIWAIAWLLSPVLQHPLRNKLQQSFPGSGPLGGSRGLKKGVAKANIRIKLYSFSIWE